MAARHTQRRRIGGAAFLLLLLAMASCNVLSSLGQCSSDAECASTSQCDIVVGVCFPRAATEPVEEDDDAASVRLPDQGGSSVDRQNSPSYERDGGDGAVPPGCLTDDAFETPTPVPGLIDRVVSAVRLSEDETELLFSGPSGIGIDESCDECSDLFRATRSGTGGQAFTSPQPLSDLNRDASAEHAPMRTDYGGSIVFESSRLADGGSGRARVWRAGRHTNDATKYFAPIVRPLLPEQPSLIERSPYTIFEGRILYFSSNALGSFDIYRATLDNGLASIRSIDNETAINTVALETAPVATHDDSTLYFARAQSPDGQSALQILSSKAIWMDGLRTFGTPTPVVGVHAPDIAEGAPPIDDLPSFISADQCRLYFISTRPLPGAPAQTRERHAWVASRPRRAADGGL